MWEMFGIEILIQLYYQYSLEMLTGAIIVIALFTICLYIACKKYIVIDNLKSQLCGKKDKNKNSIFSKIGNLFVKVIKNIFYIFVITCIATFLKLLGIAVQLPNEKIPLYIVCFICVSMGALFIYMFIKYKHNRLEVIKTILKYLKILISGEVFLLASFSRLDSIEIITAVVFLTCGNVIINLHLQEEEPDRLQITDLEIDDYKKLFNSRKVQLDNFQAEIEYENRDNEPFAISISAPWGYGKTSFINAFSEKCTKGEFVRIKVGFECDIVRILDDIEKQIENIFVTNKIYIEKGNPIRKYFKCIADLVNATDINVVKKYFEYVNIVEKEGYEDNKKNVNEYLKRFYKQTSKKIYIIIDDIERSMPKAREKIFGVIYESINLKNCTTIFLTDNEKLKTPNMTSEYLEKYINKTVLLCSVPFEEIVDFYSNDFLNEEFFVGKSDYVISNGKKLKMNFVNYTYSIFNYIQNSFDEILKELTNINSDEDKKVLESEKATLQNAMNRLDVRICNPRKVKRYMRDGVQRLVQSMDIMWFSNPDYRQNSYSQSNWMEIAVQVSFIKYFLEEDYEKLVNCNGLYVYKNKYPRSILEWVIKGSNGYLSDNATEAIVEMLVYNSYTFNSKKNMSEQDGLLCEIKNNKMEEKNLSAYIEKTMGWGMNIDILEKVLDFVIENNVKRADILILILKKVTEHYFERAEVVGVQKKLKNFIETNKKGFLKKDIDKISAQIEHYISICIMSNQKYIMWILRLAGCDNNRINEFMDSPDCNWINSSKEWLSVLKELDNSDYLLNKNGQNLEVIEKYFEKLFLKLQGNEYNEIQHEINNYEKHIKFLIEVMRIWEIDEKEILEKKKQFISLDDAKFYEYRVDCIEDATKALEDISKALFQSEKTGSQSIVAIFWQYCRWMNDNIDKIGGGYNLIRDIKKEYEYIRDNFTELDDRFYENAFLIREMENKMKGK